MSYGPPSTGTDIPISLELQEGWHCSHLYYRFDRAALAHMSPAAIQAGRAELIAVLDPGRDGAPVRLQTSAVTGHKAAFGLMLMDANPLRVDGVHQQLMASSIGPALIPTYSFVSVTKRSGTRKEELLLSEEVLNRVWILRKLLTTLNTIDSMEFLLEKMKGTRSNKDFLNSMNA